MAPLVSVITVVYNMKDGLERTIQSVQTQQLKDVEHIVIDGNSTDGTQDIIQKYHHQLAYSVSEPDNGLYDAMNKGIRAAKGTWLQFLNAGDVYTRDNTLSSLFAKDYDGVQFVYGDTFLVKEDHSPVRYLKSGHVKDLAKGMVICHQSMFVRRSHCPEYKATLSHKGDYNWVLDVCLPLTPSQIHYEPIDIVFYQMGGFSDVDFWGHFKQYLQIARKRLGFWSLVKVSPYLLRRVLGVTLRRLLGVHTLRFWLNT